MAESHSARTADFKTNPTALPKSLELTNPHPNPASANPCPRKSIRRCRVVRVWLGEDGDSCWPGNGFPGRWPDADKPLRFRPKRGQLLLQVQRSNTSCHLR